MRTYLTENEIALDERQKTKLLDTVEKLEIAGEVPRAIKLLALPFFSR